MTASQRTTNNVSRYRLNRVFHVELCAVDRTGEVRIYVKRQALKEMLNYVPYTNL